MPASTLPSNDSRREFLKKSTAVAVGSSVAATLTAARAVHAAGTETLKVGLIGCGGRGSGAAVNAMRAEEHVALTAMADAFGDQLEHSQNILKRQLGDKFKVTPETSFVGFDAYQKVLAADVDVVLLCTPPHFRPVQLRAAIEAGKHVFCEKPVAVDPTGVRSVLETCELARTKNLSIVSGLCWRYDHAVRETIRRIHDGAIGELQTIQENYLTGTLWQRPRKADWSEMEYQLRNWLYYTWLSGDHIVEQHVHSLDKALWLMRDQPPARCYGMGGRQVRTEEIFGNIFDHFAVCYEWDNGVKAFAFTRQMAGCFNEVDDYVTGTQGRALVLGTGRRPRITNADGQWDYQGDSPSMYDVEHKELFAGIRSGKIINNGTYMSYSTLMAIMGREVCYSGQAVTWEEALNSSQNLTPAKYVWEDIPRPQVPMPGQSKFA